MPRIQSKPWLIILLCLLLSACGGGKTKKSDGGYYGGDSPPDETRDYDSIPDAIPKAEPLSKTGNKPYTALGKQFIPLKSSTGFTETGIASWYGKKFHGRRTSSGETYDIWKMTAAHPTLPLPTYVRVTSLENAKTIVVKVNDRGPFLHGRIIDLSYAAAHKIGIANAGTGKVTIAAIDPSVLAVGSNSEQSSEPETEYQTQSGTAGGTTDSYFIQIGAYNDESNVMTMRKRLSNAGFPVYPLSNQQQFSGNPPYRVRVGPFDNIDSALNSMKKLDVILEQNSLVLVK